MRATSLFQCGMTQLAKKCFLWSQLDVYSLESLCISPRIPLAGPSLHVTMLNLFSKSKKYIFLKCVQNFFPNSYGMINK